MFIREIIIITCNFNFHFIKVVIHILFYTKLQLFLKLMNNLLLNNGNLSRDGDSHRKYTATDAAVAMFSLKRFSAAADSALAFPPIGVGKHASGRPGKECAD